MKLSKARAESARAVLQVSQQAYPIVQMDEAIHVTLLKLVNRTNCIIARDTLTIPTDVSEVDLSELAADDPLLELLPGFFSHASIDGVKLKRADKDFCRNRSATLTGEPKHMAFETDKIILFDRTTDDEYTAKVVWFPPLITWQHGTAAPVEINIDDRYLSPAVWDGIAAALVYGEATNNPWPVTARKHFDDYCVEVAAMVSTESGIGKRHPYEPKPAPPAQRK